MNLQEMKECTDRDTARQLAIDWQYEYSQKSMSYAELIEWQDIFETLAQKFDLWEEFKENGIL